MEVSKEIRSQPTKIQIESPKIRTWFENYFPWIRKHPYRWWGLIGSASVLISAILRFMAGPGLFSFPFIPVSLGIALIPLATRLGYNILLDWEEQVVTFIVHDNDAQLRNWYRARFTQGAESR